MSFTTNEVVLIQGIRAQQHQDLNGTKGVVQGRDKNTGRYVVCSGLDGRIVSFKAENLTLGLLRGEELQTREQAEAIVAEIKAQRFSAREGDRETIEKAGPVSTTATGKARLLRMRILQEVYCGLPAKAEKSIKVYFRKTLALWNVEAAAIQMEAALRLKRCESFGPNEGLQVANMFLAHALCFQPKNPDALLMRGMCLLARTEFSEGLQALAQASVYPARCFNHPESLSLAQRMVAPYVEGTNPAVVGARWKRLDPAPSVEPPLRLFMSQCQDADTLYIFGGEGMKAGPNRSDQMVAALSPAELDKWLASCPIPAEVRDAAGNDVEKKRALFRVVMNRMDPEAGEKNLNDTWALDLQSLKWRQMEAAKPPTPRQGAAMWACSGCLYVHGGEASGGQAMSDLHVLELAPGSLRWSRVKQRGAIPSARSFHSAFAVGERIYVWGGELDSGDDQPPDRNLYCATMGKGAVTWKCIVPSGPSPYPRSKHMWWVEDGAGGGGSGGDSSLVVYGGNHLEWIKSGPLEDTLTNAHGPSGPINLEMWSCDLKTGCWQVRENHSKLPPAPFAESACCSTRGGAEKARKWVFGGYWEGWTRVTVEESRGADTKRCIKPEMMHSFYYDHLYLCLSGEWKLVVAEGDPPARRGGAAIAELPGGKGIVMWGGYNTLNEAMTSFEDDPRLLPGLWTCTLQDKVALLDHAQTATEADTSAQGAATTEARPGSGGAGGPRAAAAAGRTPAKPELPLEKSEMALMQIDVGSWFEACRQVVTRSDHLRGRMSGAYLKAMNDTAHQRRPPGALVISYPLPHALPTEVMNPTQGFKYVTMGSTDVFPDPHCTAAFERLLSSIISAPEYSRQLGFIVVLVPAAVPPAMFESALESLRREFIVSCDGQPAFKDLSNVEQRVEVWSNMIQGFTFGYAGGYNGVDPKVQHRDMSDSTPCSSSTKMIEEMLSATQVEQIGTASKVVRKCSNCGAPELLESLGASLRAQGLPVTGKFKTCSRCKQAFYCSAACQKNHWKAGHKQECKEPPEKMTWQKKLIPE